LREARPLDTLGGMNTFSLAAALAGVSLTVALAGCSSEPTATAVADAAAVPAVADLPAAPAVADLPAAPPTTGAPVRVGAAEFADVIQMPGIQIIDVRTPEEFAGGHIRGAVNIPVSGPDFAARIAELDPAASYAVYCRSGNRSQPAVAAMTDAGITSIYELADGTRGWVTAGQPLTG
jgi:phage shock protein E